jgi:exonuclease SbcD
MKLVHTADLHIGKVVNEFSMCKDQDYVLKQILDILKEEEADALLIAGDVYDRSIPPAEAVNLLDEFLTELVNRNIKVFLISGNHDSPDRLNFAGSILNNSGVYIAGTFTEQMKKVSIADEYGMVHIHLLPYAKPQVMRYYLGDEYKEHEVEEYIKRNLKSTRERNILITHHFVTNQGVSPEQSDSEMPLSIGGTDCVEAGALKVFDYVALGHIHRGQKVKEEWIRYSGSPLKYSFSEVFHKKSVTVIELKEKGNVTIYERPLFALHDMRKIKGSLKELIKDETVQAADPNDYLQVTLTDTKELVDPIGTLRSVYPNVMQLILEKNIRTERELIQVDEKIKNRSTLEIYSEFFETVTGRAFDEKRKEVIQTALEEVGGGQAK